MAKAKTSRATTTRKFKTSEEVLEIIDNRLSKLRKIILSENPTNESMLKKHKKKVEKASEYFAQLMGVKLLVEYAGKVNVVPLPTMNKLLDDADYVSLLYDEEYVIFCQASNNPYDADDPDMRNYFVLWMEPISHI